MIVATYTKPKNKRGPYKLIITGHANYSTDGKDIVCASVSTLAQALAYHLDSEAYKMLAIKLDPGDIDIRCDTAYNFGKEEQIEKSFSLIAEGIEAVSHAYEKNVTFIKKLEAVG